MALTDSLRSAKEGFARLSVGKKVLVIGLSAAAVAAVALWAANGMPDASVPETASTSPSVVTTGSASVVSTSSAATATAAASSTASASTSTAAAATSKPKTSSASSSSKSSSTSKPTTKKPSNTELTEATVGLTKAQRKAIALKIIAMEKQATEEADEKYPTDPEKGGSEDNYEKNLQYWTELDEQYKAEIMEEFDISLDQLIFILIVDVSQYMQ